MSSSKLILWDLDGTLYPETHEVKDAFRRAVCNALRNVVDPALSDEAAYDLIKKSRQDHGDSFTGLIKKGFKASTLHEAHHARLDPKVVQRNEETIKAFERAREAGVRHAIMTHGHMNWTLQVLEKAGLREFFDEADIISVEKIDFLKKHTGPEPFKRALALLGEKPENTTMVEDKAANLVHPHAMGMKTIMVHYGKIKEDVPKPDYVWHRCATPAQAIDAVLTTLNRDAAPAPDNRHKPK